MTVTNDGRIEFADHKPDEFVVLDINLETNDESTSSNH